MYETIQTQSVAEWQRAPKDGSVIFVEFASGEIAKAQFDLKRNEWQLPRPDGKGVMMHQVRLDDPQDWWPEF